MNISYQDLQLLEDSPEEFSQAYNVDLAGVEEAIAEVAAQTIAFWNAAGSESAPFACVALDTASNGVVGACGFKGPPDADRAVEIAYITFPLHRNRGYGAAMACELVSLARQAGVQKVIAHTLPERTASARILERAGFELVGEVTDPDDGRVWRWARTVSS